MASTENGDFAALVLGDRDLVLFGERDQILAALELPLAPRRDDPDSRLERVVAQLEAHLVVALAGGAVAHGIGARGARDVDLLLGDQRPRDRGAEQVDALIEGVGAEHREHIVAHELLAQILDEDVGRLDAEHQRLLARGLKLVALAEIGGERHHLGAVGLLQPLEDDRGVEAARVGEDHFLDGLFWHEGFGFRDAALAPRNIKGCGVGQRTIGTGRPTATKRGSL